MNAKRFLAFAIAVFSLVGALGFTPPASAGVRIGIGIGLPVFFPPPPLRREVVYARPSRRLLATAITGSAATGTGAPLSATTPGSAAVGCSRASVTPSGSRRGSGTASTIGVTGAAATTASLSAAMAVFAITASERG